MCAVIVFLTTLCIVLTAPCFSHKRFFFLLPCTLGKKTKFLFCSFYQLAFLLYDFSLHNNINTATPWTAASFFFQRFFWPENRVIEDMLTQKWFYNEIVLKRKHLLNKIKHNYNVFCCCCCSLQLKKKVYLI